MPSIEENRRNWDDPANWLQAGDEWSHAWGGSRSLWLGTLLPRLAAHLPTGHLLEIACGHGRITEFLLPQCTRYTGVDLAPSCVAKCRQRFAGRAHAAFHVTDGRSLEAVADGSVDVAFSWDSLVHAEQDAMQAYVEALGRKLVPGGVAWLHHSNVGAFAGADGALTIANPHWRGASVSANHLREWAHAAGLHVRAQELLQWDAPQHTDCISLLERARAGAALVTCTPDAHPDFNVEMAHFRRLHALYGKAR